MATVSLNINQLADAVAQGGTDRSLVMQRLRHWVTLGLLPIEGDSNPGTGRSRHFAKKAVMIAKILNELAEHGIGAGGKALHSKFFQECFAQAEAAIADAARRGGKAVVFLAISRGQDLPMNPLCGWSLSVDIKTADFSPDGKPFTYPAGTLAIIPNQAISTVLINLTRLLH